MWPRSVKSYALIRVDDVSFQAVPCFNMFAVCTCMLFEHMVVGPKQKGLGTRIIGPCEIGCSLFEFQETRPTKAISWTRAVLRFEAMGSMLCCRWLCNWATAGTRTTGHCRPM